MSLKLARFPRAKGPSVQVQVASQLRGLQLLSDSNLSMDHQQAHQQHLPQQHHLMEQLPLTSTTINSTLPQSIIMPSPVTSSISNLTDQQYPLAISTSTHSLYPITITEEQNYHNTIGNLRTSSDDDVQHVLHTDNNEQQEQFTVLPSLHPHPGGGHFMTSYDQLLSRYTGGAVYTGDIPPFSPDIPDQYHQSMDGTTTLITTTSESPNSHMMTEYDDEIMQQPQSALAPSSPSISSSGQLQMNNNNSSMPATASMPIEPKKRSTASTAAVTTSEYRCDICDKVFNKSCYLTQHNKTFHCGYKPFKCQRCGKRFSCDASHEEHVAKHGGNKPFKCSQCPKAFNHKTDLRRHMCLHSGTKPYTCLQCGKGFIRKDHMVKHTETHSKKKGNGNKKVKNGKKRLSSINIPPDSNDSLNYADTPSD
ncbi:hypothetical protein PVAND_003590 [Polypedilum vanderplanki]|uniref:C2H2-type domain-containing protein n=1 Tax=Polypedilum vanderplanki TaxID=319348 RepID=A0A9J6BWB0_POLVA|nr:hypothetical protein PVAND_003590 [Polypedilum vanderplanki]